MVYTPAIDREHFRVDALEKAVTFAASCPQGPSTESTLSQIDDIPILPQHRPTLEAPKHFSLQMIELLQKGELLDQKELKVRDAHIQKFQAQIERLETEKEKALEEEAEATAHRHTWSLCATVAQYITSVAAFTGGLAVGGAAGACLAAAGVIGMMTRVSQDTNLARIAAGHLIESKEKQQEYLQKMELGAMALQLGLSVAGGALAWRGSSLATSSAVDILKKGSAAVGTASTLMGAATQFGTKLYDKKIAELQAHMKQNSSDIAYTQQSMGQQVAQLIHTIETAQTKTEATHHVVRKLQVYT